MRTFRGVVQFKDGHERFISRTTHGPTGCRERDHAWEKMCTPAFIRDGMNQQHMGIRELSRRVGIANPRTVSAIANGIIPVPAGLGLRFFAVLMGIPSAPGYLEVPQPA